MRHYIEIGGFVIISVALFTAGYLGNTIWDNTHPCKTAVDKDQLSVNKYPLPVILNIRGVTFRVVLMEKGGFDGYTDCRTKIIEYAEDEGKAELRDTMWHEIMHAANCNNGLYNNNSGYWVSLGITDEHKQIYKNGPFLAAFVHDNPEFMKWAENW